MKGVKHKSRPKIHVDMAEGCSQNLHLKKEDVACKRRRLIRDNETDISEGNWIIASNLRFGYWLMHSSCPGIRTMNEPRANDRVTAFSNMQ